MNDDNREKDPCLTIRVFDVGHGDSILIEFPDGKHVGIVDCHVHSHSHRGCGAEFWDESEAKVLTYLKSRLKSGEDLKVAFVCLSHFHDDHYLGFGQLIKELQNMDVVIDRLWDPGKSVRKAVVKQLEKSGFTEEQRKSILELECFYKALMPFKNNGMKFEALVKPQKDICSISSVDVDILAPDGWHWDDYNDFLSSLNGEDYSKKNAVSANENLICSAIMLRYGKAKVILGGDLTCLAWNQVVENWGHTYVRANAVKVSHHGSKEGNFLYSPQQKKYESLWEHVSIKNSTIAAISGGYRKDLPHLDTLAELKTYGVETYCTGRFDQSLDQDPIREIGLSEDVCTHLEIVSIPILEDISTHHGDIMLRIYNDGNVEPIAELDAHCL